MSQPPFRNVFVATDLDAHDAIALAHGLRLVLARGGELDLVHVHRPEVSVDWSKLPTVRALLIRWGRLHADPSVADFERLGITVRHEALPSLDLLEPLSAAAAAADAELVVVSTGARSGFARLREPSVAEALAQRVPVPTLFVPEGVEGFVDAASGSVSLRRVLVPVARPDDARGSIAAAIRLVESFDAAPCEFILMHAGQRGDFPALMLPDDDPRWTWRIDVRAGSLDREVVNAVGAHDVDAVVMGTHGHNSIADELRGSHTEVVIRNAGVPTLSVPLPRP